MNVMKQVNDHLQKNTEMLQNFLFGGGWGGGDFNIQALQQTGK
jgi:hypothetical protein